MPRSLGDMLGAAVTREAPATRRVRVTLSVVRHNIVTGGNILTGKISLERFALSWYEILI